MREGHNLLASFIDKIKVLAGKIVKFIEEYYKVITVILGVVTLILMILNK